MRHQVFAARRWWDRASRRARIVCIAVLAIALTAGIIVPAAMRDSPPDRGIATTDPPVGPTPELVSPTPSPESSQSEGGRTLEASMVAPHASPRPAEANGDSGAEGLGGSDISADGRYIAFASLATNLTADANDGVQHVFRRDRREHRTILVSLSPSGKALEHAAVVSDLSGDGEVISYIEYNTKKLDAEPNASCPCPHPIAAYIHDIPSHRVRRINPPGAPGWVALSYDGRYAAVNFGGQIYRLDTTTGDVKVASTSSNGLPGNGDSCCQSITADGRYVAFSSEATNLVPNDTNKMLDMFVHDVATGKTTRVSVKQDGSQPERQDQVNPWTGGFGSISADGHYAVFFSNGAHMAPESSTCEAGLYVKDLQTGELDSSLLTQNVCGGVYGSISAHGGRVVFRQFGMKLYQWDRSREDVELIFNCKADEPGIDAGGLSAELSASGSAIVYATRCTHDPDDHNRVIDVYVHDLKTGRDERVSVPDGA